MSEKPKGRINLGKDEIIKLINDLKEAVGWRDFTENVWPERMFQSASRSITLFIPRDWKDRIPHYRREMTFERVPLVPMISHHFDEIYGFRVSDLKENMDDIIEREELAEDIFKTTVGRGIYRETRGSYALRTTWRTGYFNEFCDLSYLTSILTKEEGNVRQRVIKVQRPHLLEWYELAKNENMKAPDSLNREVTVRYY